MCRRLGRLLSPRGVCSTFYPPIYKANCILGAKIGAFRLSSSRFIATSRILANADIDRRKHQISQARGNYGKHPEEDPFQYLHGQFASPVSKQSQKEGRSTGTTLIGIFISLFGVTFACVPLYEYFCQQSGYMGTTKRVKVYRPPSEDRGGRLFEIDFITHSQLEWDFKPLQRSVVIAPGETTLAFYTAKNRTNNPIIGIAAYHVIPDEAGVYFNKIQCFCFEEQMLNPGEEVDLPVLFFLDPDIVKDKRLFDVDKITLTYTFFEANSEIPPEYITMLNRDGNTKS